MSTRQQKFIILFSFIGLFIFGCIGQTQKAEQTVNVAAPQTTIGGGNVAGDQINIGGQGHNVNIYTEKIENLQLNVNGENINVIFITSSKFENAINSIKSGNTAQAVKEFEKIQQENPKDIDALFNLGNAYLVNNEYDKAIEN